MIALDDVTVLDLSHALAGPFASTLLGDYGADIIKIEPLEGEIARAWGPPFYGNETAYFVNLNRNKKSIALDLKHPEGRGDLLPAARRALTSCWKTSASAPSRGSASITREASRAPAANRLLLDLRLRTGRPVPRARRARSGRAG